MIVIIMHKKEPPILNIANSKRYVASYHAKNDIHALHVGTYINTTHILNVYFRYNYYTLKKCNLQVLF